MLPEPPVKQVEQLLDVAFAATFQNEEGRRTPFTLAFVSASDADGFGCGIDRFVEPQPFSAAHVVKLAPATDRRETVIAVHANEGGDLAIWG